MTSRTGRLSAAGLWARRTIARLPGPVRSRLRGLARGAPSIDNSSQLSAKYSTPSGELLTEADIISAYRLFHGREPDKDGLDFFTNQIGKWSVRDMLPYFAHSAEFRQSDTYRVLVGGLAGGNTHLIDVGDHQLLIPENDEAIGGVLARTGSYEPHIVAVFDEILERGSVVIDGGANIGILTMRAADLVGETGRVIAVEALAYNVGLICISAALNGYAHVDVVHAALGERTGAVAMTVAGGSNAIMGGPLTELLKTTDPAQLVAEEVVPVVKLDDIANQLGQVDLVKLDVEGAEALALRGASALLARHRPVMVLEYSPGLLAQVSDVEGTTMLTDLVEHGYTLQILGPDERVDIGHDVYACRRTLTETNADHLDLLALPD